MKDLWNGMFDFNGDGQMDIGEEFLAYKIYEETAFLSPVRSTV